MTKDTLRKANNILEEIERLQVQYHVVNRIYKENKDAKGFEELEKVCVIATDLITRMQDINKEEFNKI